MLLQTCTYNKTTISYTIAINNILYTMTLSRKAKYLVLNFSFSLCKKLLTIVIQYNHYGCAGIATAKVIR